MEVIPSIAPSPDAMPEPTSAQIRTYGPPVITFALPEAGEQIVPETQFVIQFSNPMDPGSIQGRVSLAYANPRAGDPASPARRHGCGSPTEHEIRGSSRCCGIFPVSAR